MEFKQIEKEFNLKVSEIDSEDFRIFVNGLCQAEGVFGVYFPKPDSLRTVFYFCIGQNYSSEAAQLFLVLQRSLGGIGNIKLDTSSTGKTHIRFVVTNTKDVLEK